MIEALLHKFYAASITIGADGSMLVSSTDERILAWTLLLCIITLVSITARLLWGNRYPGKMAMMALAGTLIMTALIMPSIGHEYIHASRNSLTIETGEWYGQSQTVVGMKDIEYIRESDPNGMLPANLIGDPAIDWHLTRANGKSEIIGLNDFFNAHRMVVAYYYKDRGYRLERLEDRGRTN